MSTQNKQKKVEKTQIQKQKWQKQTKNREKHNKKSVKQKNKGEPSLLLIKNVFLARSAVAKIVARTVVI